MNGRVWQHCDNAILWLHCCSLSYRVGLLIIIITVAVIFILRAASRQSKREHTSLLVAS